MINDDVRQKLELLTTMNAEFRQRNRELREKLLEQELLIEDSTRAATDASELLSLQTTQDCQPAGSLGPSVGIINETATPPATSDRAADMRKVCEALGFEPDNHHNALKCPYCNPNGLELATTSGNHPVGVDRESFAKGAEWAAQMADFLGSQAPNKDMEDTAEILAKAIRVAMADAALGHTDALLK